jgi:UDP-2,4-diacetamido-2,4,6-trideoxy-beta-L-altropyranose hydrolase
MRAPEPSLVEQLAGAAIACHAIGGDVEPGSGEDAEATMAAIQPGNGKPLLVVDHYRVGESWEKRLRPHVERLAVIDDLADRPHDCDILVDQNKVFDQDAYEGLIPASAKALVGPRYALLRPEFAQWRAVPRRRDGRLRRMAVSFGGSDPAGHTAAALQVLRSRLHRLDAVDVLVGPLNSRLDELLREGEKSAKVEVHVASTRVAELLHGADLAIGGGGLTSWERLCLSVPALAFGIVPNQIENVRDLIRLGVAVGTPDMRRPEEKSIAGWLDILFDTPELVRGMAERGAGLVDGAGARRVATRLLSGSLAFRRAGPADSILVHTWRNHPANRSVSGNAAEIALEDHRRWFAKSLADPTRLILIAELDGLAVGVARFDMSGSQATISVFKDPEMTRPIDLVGQATQWLFDERGDIATIRAVVLAHNSRSAQAFEGAGYQLRERCYVARRQKSGDGPGSDR